MCNQLEDVTNINSSTILFGLIIKIYITTARGQYIINMYNKKCVLFVLLLSSKFKHPLEASEKRKNSVYLSSVCWERCNF